MPERWRVLEEDVRRCLVRVFPYSVLYTIEADYVLIMPSRTRNGSRAIGGIGCHFARRADRLPDFFQR